MRKRTSKILSFIISVAILGYGLGTHMVLNPEANVAKAHTQTISHHNDSDCTETSFDCAQETAQHCDDCTVFHSGCHADYMSISENTFEFLNAENMPISSHDYWHVNLQYTPKTPPA